MNAPVSLEEELNRDPRLGPFRALLKMAWPSVLTGGIKASYSLADVWCGGRVSKDALTALAVSVLFVWIFHSFSRTNAIGALALISRAFGRGDFEDARGVLWRSVQIGALLGVIVALLIALAYVVFESALNMSPPVVVEVRRYLLVIAILGPGLYVYDTLEQGFRALGEPLVPMIVFGVFALVNLGVNPMLALGLDLGVVGIALATGLSWWLASAVLVVLALRRGWRPRSLPHGFEVAWRTFRIGLPTALSHVAFDLIWLLLVPVFTATDELALAAVSVAHRLESVSYLTAVGLGLAAAALIGQAIGLKRPNLVRGLARRAGLVALVFSSTCVAVFLTFSEEAFALFTDDERVISIGCDYMLLASIPIVVQALEGVYTAAFAGIGHTVTPSVVTMLSYGARIPLARIFAPIFGVNAIFIVIGATASASGVLIMILFLMLAARLAHAAIDRMS